MTITTQHTEFGGIDAPGDQHPGTLDVRWAEEACVGPREPISLMPFGDSSRVADHVEVFAA